MLSVALAVQYEHDNRTVSTKVFAHAQLKWLPYSHSHSVFFFSREILLLLILISHLLKFK